MKIIIKLLVFIFLVNCNSSKKDFKLCSGNTRPYYYPALEYKEGFYKIKKYLYDNYHKVESFNNSGIVKIRFHVNCKGQPGNYTLETYSLDYKNMIVDSVITNQLLKLTKDLKEWIPALDEDGNFVNSHKFFAFKLVDGELKDILPK